MRGKRVLKRRRFVILQNANIISLEGYFLALATTTKPLFSYEGTTKRGKAHFVFWLLVILNSDYSVIHQQKLSQRSRYFLGKNIEFFFLGKKFLSINPRQMQIWACCDNTDG